MTGPRTLTEYAIRYTQLGRNPTGGGIARKVHYRRTHRSTRIEDLAAVKAWQDDHKTVCPEIDAVVVTRIVTFGDWFVEEKPVANPVSYRGGPELDPASEDDYRAEQADYDAGTGP